MRLFRPISLGLLALALATPASPQGISPIEIGLKAAQATGRFALIFVTDGSPGALESSTDQVRADPRLRTHIVYVCSTIAKEPDAIKIAALVSELPPKIPVLVLITPTAQGFNALGGISGTPSASVLQQWLIGKICSVLAQHLDGAPPADADLTALCQPTAIAAPGTPNLGNLGTPPATPAQLPLTRTESDLSRLTRETPHLAGTWKGPAQKIVCGEPRGTVQLVLTLTDSGYKAANSALVVGNVTGNLSVDGTPKGAFGADYGNATLQTNPLDQSFATAFTPLDLQHAHAAPQFRHYVKLAAKDSWAGFGNYQTLTGAFFASDSACPQYGDQGRVLKAQLKKQ